MILQVFFYLYATEPSDMMKKTLISVILLLAVAFSTYAQQHCFFTHYSTEDGLSQNTVMNILQDHKDNLWFATWDGINRFNGYTFKTYKARQGNYISLTNNRVDRMYEDRYGFLWLLTYDNRVHRFDPKTETFEQVPAAGEEGSAFNVHTIEVMPNGTVWLLTENDGAIRILTHPDENNRLTWDIYSSKTELFPSLHVFKVHQDKAGNDWLLTDNGLGMIHPGKKEPDSYFTETKGKFGGMNQAFYAVQERDKDIRLGSWTHLVLSERKRRVYVDRASHKRTDHLHSSHCTGRIRYYYRFGWLFYLQPANKNKRTLLVPDL